jgi:cytoskeletal protein CcmA (bactofilin family)
MSFFKDNKGDTEQPIDEALNEVKAEEKAEELDVNKEDESTIDEDFLDEDMYKDILAAAEQMLSEESGEPLDEDASDSANEDDTSSTNNEMVEKVEDTMVDFDENVADEEILDTLLKEEDKLEAAKEVSKSETSMHAANPDLADEDKDAITVITRGTTINGSIISDCSLDVMGTINGDIECLGKLSISGKVTGNSMASEVYVNTDRLEGCINSEGSVKIGLGTVVIGDITASSGVIAGAVKGEIDIAGPIVIDSTAIIKGNIKAKSVQMNNGAVLEGFCSLSYASVDINDIFE